jgi:hypothetical protein
MLSLTPIATQEEHVDGRMAHNTDVLFYCEIRYTRSKARDQCFHEDDSFIAAIIREEYGQWGTMFSNEDMELYMNSSAPGSQYNRERYLGKHKTAIYRLADSDCSGHGSYKSFLVLGASWTAFLSQILPTREREFQNPIDRCYYWGIKCPTIV